MERDAKTDRTWNSICGGSARGNTLKCFETRDSSENRNRNNTKMFILCYSVIILENCIHAVLIIHYVISACNSRLRPKCFGA